MVTNKESNYEERKISRIFEEIVKRNESVVENETFRK